MYSTGVCSSSQNFDTKISIYLFVSESLQIKIYHIYIVQRNLSLSEKCPTASQTYLAKKQDFLTCQMWGKWILQQNGLSFVHFKKRDWISEILTAQLPMKPCIWNVYCLPEKLNRYIFIRFQIWPFKFKLICRQTLVRWVSCDITIA